MKKILVIDDDLDTLNILRIKLEAHQYEVITGRDGQEALSLIREHRPDLIIMDVMMPKLSGFKATRLIKFDAKSKHIPLIILTARTQDADRTLGLEVGADVYVTKPLEPEELLKEVERLLVQGAK